MQITPTAIPEVVLVEPKLFRDERGYFLETFQARKTTEVGITLPMVQDNQSGSHRGVLRGLHYQIHKPQGKLASVVAGEVLLPRALARWDPRAAARESFPLPQAALGIRVAPPFLGGACPFLAILARVRNCPSVTPTKRLRLNSLTRALPL